MSSNWISLERRKRPGLTCGQAAGAQHIPVLFLLHESSRTWRFSTSLALGQPVRTLLRDRAPLTLRLLAVGLGLGWVAALTLR